MSIEVVDSMFDPWIRIILGPEEARNLSRVLDVRQGYGAKKAEQFLGALGAAVAEALEAERANRRQRGKARG